MIEMDFITKISSSIHEVFSVTNVLEVFESVFNFSNNNIELEMRTEVRERNRKHTK